MDKKVVVLLLIIAFVLILARKMKPNVVTSANSTPANMEQIINGFKFLIDKGYDKAFVADIERLFRLETAHFKSGQFKKGYSPGMVATGMIFPYGWSSLKTFASAMNLPSGLFPITPPFPPSGFKYVMFPDFLSSIAFVAWFIKNKRGGVVEQWNSLDPATASRYRAKLNEIKSRITNTL